MKLAIQGWVCVLLLACLAVPATAQPEPPGHAWGLVKQDVDAYFQELTDRGDFSGAVLVAREGKVILAKGYGYADWTAGVRNRPDTVYYVASFTKAFTAMSVMMLRERGLLDLDDPVSWYVPELATGHLLTLRNLLNQNSGLFDYVNNPLLFDHVTDYHTPEDLLQYFADEPLTFPPGSQFEYCNSNYVLLGLIVERVSGLAFQDFLRQNILDPLGLENTAYDPYDALFPDKAVGYDDVTTDPPLEAIRVHPSIPFAAGAMVSTVEDLYRWDQALYGDQLISAASLAEMLTPGLGDYGMGWYVDEMEVAGRAHRHVWHWGSYFGFHGYFSRLVDDRVTLLIQLNLGPRQDSPDELRPHAEAVAAMVFARD
jgi:CubicO group peptidase (beta-lactamase class C family)